MEHTASSVVILNGAAGTAAGGVGSDTELRDLFRAAGGDVEIVRLRPGQNPTDAARAASARARMVVAAGGDGTVNAVVNGMIDSSAALGVLPLGTLNHFAKDAGIPTALREAVDVIVAGRTARVDVGRVNDRVFVNNSSIGVYPDIVERREALRVQGHRKWPAFAMATLDVLRRHPGVAVTLDVNGRSHRLRSPFVAIGNNEYAVEGRRMGGRTRLDAGKLFVYLAPRTRTRELPMLVFNALIGRVGQAGAFEIAAVTELRIHPAGPGRIAVALDGEVETMSTPLLYRVSPAALTVALPAN
jgi:diacylglycerol kinase family enzyme